jgi:hypothetical protein
MVSQEEVLLEEWKACEETIRNLDRILNNIRFHGITVTIALMGAAAETLRSPQAIINFYDRPLHIAVFIETLSVIFATILYILHKHYLQFLLLAVRRQREIEQKELLIDGKAVLRLGQAITRKEMQRFFRDPWNYLFGFLIVLGLSLTVVYIQMSIMAN